jgi:nucleoside-diphosphate-sugar epimerase/quercetin dioxygenase-like cupin family protein
MARTAFVTGAAGFLGRHLVEELERQGWETTAFCRETDRTDLLSSAIRIEMGDLTDADRVREALPDHVDAIFHLAGNTTTWSKNAAAQFRDNVDGTAHVIEAALVKYARRLIYTSSTSAYGYQPGVRIDERTVSNAPTRGDNYGKSKLQAEGLIKQACAERGLSAVILNPVNIVGAYDTTNWSQHLILPISKGSLRVVPPGSATWISVHDVVKAHIAAVDVEESGTNFVLGGVEASFREVTNEIEAILGKPHSRRATSKATLGLLLLLSSGKAVATRAEPEFTLAKYQRAVGDLLVDDRKARQLLGLERTTLHDMLAETIDWLEQVGMLDQPESAQRTRALRGRPGSASGSLRGVDWVEVNDEPNHVEQFRNDAVRVYEARIDPGAATLYHHHSLDTIYVIMAGGRFRSEEPVHQKSSTKLGRSVSLPTKLAWGIRRALTGGTLQMPAGTFLMQYHRAHPLVHRVVASSQNAVPIRMLGIELHARSHPSLLRTGSGVRLEYADGHARTYRIRRETGEWTDILQPEHGAVLAVTAGTGVLSIEGTERHLAAGSVAWIAPSTHMRLGNPGATTLSCFLVIL